MCTLEKRGSVFILTLTGAGEHRLSPALLDEIRSAIGRVRSDPTSSSSSVLITKADGKYFSNGYDLALAQSSPSMGQIMSAKLRAVVSDLISLPMPTVAAVTGHAAAAGFILALSHDYVLMRRDRGFLYMSELDIGLPIPAWFMALIRLKIVSPAARRDVVLRAAKLTAAEAVERGIIDSAHDGAGETVEAAVRLAEELAGKGWDGHVYGQIRKMALKDVFDVIGFDETVEDGVRITGSKL